MPSLIRSILYLEGNLETKVFSDPITGLVRRIREVAIRRDGRLVFLGNDTEVGQPEDAELRRAGTFAIYFDVGMVKNWIISLVRGRGRIRE
ncbi:hypothetical protein HPP92_021035 [Vanilla planifolia]|uniref:Uncharacterized protein n=1 Tax=Vanilla planifolia TaxID=51239 RepID=A0A835PZ43_VANPL|nr:hypothetical protein HPP92_021035 [Vanilla planifolia]